MATCMVPPRFAASLALLVLWLSVQVLAVRPAVAMGTDGGVPISIHLPKAAFCTVVIEDSDGNRVRNLAAETYFSSGENTLYWDGYDDGARNDKGELWRHRARAGKYVVRGLSHDGVQLLYEMTVNNPGSPPWATKDGSGGWLADHRPPADILFLPQGVATLNEKGVARFLVCSTSAEAGSEFVWLDAE